MVYFFYLSFLIHSKVNSKEGNNNRFLSPLGAAPSIALVGLGLFELGFPGVIWFKFDKISSYFHLEIRNVYILMCGFTISYAYV